MQLLRREGVQDLAQRLSAMEQHAARSHELREVDVAMAEEREAAFGRLEARANNMYQQGTDLRRFADRKVDDLRTELATASQVEAGLRAALASGNQRLWFCRTGIRSPAGGI